MLSRTTRLVRSSLLKRAVRPTSSALLSVSRRTVTPITFKKYQSTLSEEPKRVETNLMDESDPNRNAFFDYSWGSWLNNDKEEKAKRRTEFSILGLSNTMSNLVGKASDSNVGKSVFEAEININAIKSNLESLKDFKFDNLNQIVSIHEGKHHRIYKFEISKGDEIKQFVLRMPYKLDSALYVSRRLKSEVATLEFLSSKLGLPVPKVLAYSASADNSIMAPFIIMEYVEGDLLMRDWNPLAAGDLQNGEVRDNLMKAIKPIADFNKQVLEFNFDAFGSLYFKEDLKAGEATLQEIDDKWVVGPTVERIFYRNKETLTDAKINQFVGPWPKENPMKLISDLLELELENFKTRLSLVKADLSVDDEEKLSKAIQVYEKFLAVAPGLFNTKSEAIPNLEELLKPKLALADLDPMNVIKKKEGGAHVFVDVEGSSIKPFLLTNYPKFLAYSGPQIFDLENEVEGWKDMDDITKQQYEYMFNRTRNQLFWELALNDADKKLLGVISPAIKLIKSAYSAALTSSNDQDYLYVENGLVELSQMWDLYKQNGLIASDNAITFDDNELQQYKDDFEKYQNEIASTPFVATKGWVPQDMLNNLLKNGMIVKDGENYKLDKDKILA